jgi:hypothetical protein
MTLELVPTKAGVIARIKTTEAGTRLCILEKSIIAIRHHLNIPHGYHHGKPILVASALVRSNAATGYGRIKFAPSSHEINGGTVTRREKSSWHWFDLPSSFAVWGNLELFAHDIRFHDGINSLDFELAYASPAQPGRTNAQPPTTTEATGHTMGLDIENTTPSEKEIIVAFLRRVPYFAELTKTDQKTISKSLASRFDRHTHPSTLGPVVATFMNFLRDQVEDGSIK